jgi:hypothetical protein
MNLTKYSYFAKLNYSVGSLTLQLPQLQISSLSRFPFKHFSLFYVHGSVHLSYIYIYMCVCVCVCVQRDTTTRSKYSLFHCKITLHVSGAFYTHPRTENQTQIHAVVYTSSASRNVDKLPVGIRSQTTRQSRRHC